MTEPTPTLGQLRAAGAELHVDRIRADFEAKLTPAARAAWDFAGAMRDLMTAPGVSAEEVAQIKARILALGNIIKPLAQDEEPTS